MKVTEDAKNRVCVCGHRFGEHVAGIKWSVVDAEDVWINGSPHSPCAEPECACEGFTPWGEN